MKLFPYLVIKSLLFSGPVDFSLTSQLFSLCAHILDLFLSRIDSIAGLYPLSAFFRTCLSSLSVNDRIQRNPMMYESEDHEQNTEEKETISKLVIIKLSRLLLRKICLRRIRLQPPALHPLIREPFPKATLDFDAFLIALTISRNMDLCFVINYELSTTVPPYIVSFNTLIHVGFLEVCTIMFILLDYYTYQLSTSLCSLPHCARVGHPFIVLFPQVTQRASFLKIRCDWCRVE